MNISIGKLEDKHIIALTGIGLVAVIYLFYAFIFVPQSEQIEQLSAQSKEEQNKLKQVEVFQSEHPDINQYLHELDDKKVMVDAMLPDDADLRGFLVQGETAARVGKLPLLSVKYEKVENQKGYREIPVAMGVQGDYFQTLNFIKSMEESSRFNSIKKIVMTMEKGSIKTAISSSIFVYGVPAEEKKAPANGQKQNK
ncbi:MAG: type 4a pilus biogenesis protein PilO [Pelosinus sp.]|nr:type 4a pilus biogenesis protein PilO [Pelosinus sp.]